MKTLERKIRERQQKDFWRKIVIILLVISVCFGAFLVFFRDLAIERSKVDRGARTDLRVPPPQTNTLSDR